MFETIEAFVELKRLAIVGVSLHSFKYGPRVYYDLKSRGYEVVPVNPGLDTFDGQTCYPNLSAIPGEVDGACIIIPPPKVPAVLRDAVEAGIGYVWLQPGAESPEAMDLADELGLELVHTACVMVEARRLGKHPTAPA